MATSKRKSDSKTALKAFDLAKKAKSKARYNEKAYGVDALPEVKWLTKSNIRELGYGGQRRLIKELEEYTYKYNEQTNFKKNDNGVVFDLGTYRKVQKLNRVTKQKALVEQKKNEKLEYIARGNQPTGITVKEKNAMLADSETKSIYDVPDIDLNKVGDQKELAKRIEKREKIIDDDYMFMRKAQYKINFIANIYKSLNSYADDIIPLLEAIPEDDFFELARQFEDFTFIDPSEPLSDEIAKAKAEGIKSVIDTYNDGGTDMSLKYIG